MPNPIRSKFPDLSLSGATIFDTHALPVPHHPKQFKVPHSLLHTERIVPAIGLNLCALALAPKHTLSLQSSDSAAFIFVFLLGTAQKLRNAMKDSTVKTCYYTCRTTICELTCLQVSASADGCKHSCRVCAGLFLPHNPIPKYPQQPASSLTKRSPVRFSYSPLGSRLPTIFCRLKEQFRW